MDNVSKIYKLANISYNLLTFILIIAPLYVVVYWIFINYIPESFITLNTLYKPTKLELSASLQLVGFLVSLLPLGALMYGVFYLRKLFSFYKVGDIFSLEQVIIFKKMAKALVLWVIFSILYTSVQSVLFSWSNLEGERVFSVTLDLNQVILLMISVILLVVAWIMDESRILYEENQLTI